jgi:hypothetical protein
VLHSTSAVLYDSGYLSTIWTDLLFPQSHRSTVRRAVVAKYTYCVMLVCVGSQRSDVDVGSDVVIATLGSVQDFVIDYCVCVRLTVQARLCPILHIHNYTRLCKTCLDAYKF